MKYQIKTKTVEQALGLAAQLKGQGFKYETDNISHPLVLARMKAPRGGYTMTFKKGVEQAVVRFSQELIGRRIKAKFFSC